MLGLIISTLLFGADFTGYFELLAFDCSNWQAKFSSIEDCTKMKEFAWLWFQYFLAMNVVGSLDIGGYLILLNYASNPFLERNKNFVLLLSDKATFKVLPATVRNAFIHKRNFYYIREPFVDYSTNNRYYVYYEGVAEPIHDIKLSKAKVTTMLATTHLDLKVKTLRQFIKMFRPSYWSRNYILVLKPDMSIEIIKGKGTGIPYRFGLFRRLWINMIRTEQQQEQEYAAAVGKSVAATTTTTVLVPTTIALEKIPNALNANFNFMVYKDYVDIYKKLSGNTIPMWLIILGVAVVAVIVFMFFNGNTTAIPKPPVEGGGS